MATHGSDKLAVLIDADNAQPKIAHELMNEISRYGTATVKRAYGDWTHVGMGSWKDILNPLAIQPIQQFAYTSGKNATDSALIIDAMDLLHAGRVDGFCLVSSDSDFTRLATRIREAGLLVYGFGEKKTPQAFVAACDKFVYTEILRPEAMATGEAVQEVEPLKPLLQAAVDATARENGWSPLSAVGSMLVKQSPSFDPRNYGFSKLSELVRNQRWLQVKDEPIAPGATNVHVYVRPKGKKAAAA
ncbi:hypothetical protein N800_02775 [Lysobacter daejeonensis GH1-9]|uniref:HTH OST-type domain-containing protein n=1 Tax=Lysobacter daejeonensis GH1-9 TaxID=1385517 RepID=A0A0A0ERY4_9GAMM|nr:NYN domain-containing protein [Lysobacter daejeonensis]KGM51902.1 hypothetical protein N800_02775 [Lysobacter daejeonensis GH1-9]